MNDSRSSNGSSPVDRQSTESGLLYIVATPIGNLSDITQRAIDTLREVDLILAEDTRHTKPLLRHFAVNTRTQAFHDHNEQAQLGNMIEKLQAGQNIALVSDAGTPLISDPGYGLVHAAQQAGLTVIPIPGACAVIAALSASGLPTDQFYFAGFTPAKSQQRLSFLRGYLEQTATLVFYESSHRVLDSLRDCVAVFGQRQATLARELTKKFETIRTATLPELHGFVAADDNQRRGEFVIIIQGQSKSAVGDDQAEIERTLTILLAELPVSQAVDLTVKLLGVKKNAVYKLALQLDKNKPS